MYSDIIIENIKVNFDVIAVDVKWTNLELNKIYKIKEIQFVQGFNMYQLVLFNMGSRGYSFDRFKVDLTEIRRQKLLKISNDD